MIGNKNYGCHFARTRHIGLITETWLKDTQEDEAWVNQSALQQNSYKTWLHNRPNDQHGGGLVLIHKKHIPIKEIRQAAQQQ